MVYTSHYMEEVEQICGRVMIMDAGRAIAQGTCDELKRLIDAGEKIVAQTAPLAPETLARLESLPCVSRASYADGELHVDCAPAAHALVDVLEELRAAGVSCGRVWSEPPTLNDVFLELCGRELRD